jgi:putative transposase
MARRTRHFLPDAIYHVMLRGNNGQAVFSSDAERCQFCLLMQQGTERYGHRILAFCFMTNHIHLVIQLKDVPLSKIFQNLSFRYTRFYNQRHKTIGHLFQGRFKSVLVEGNRYLKELIRYIHLNPVRAMMVDDPLQYRWSSHQAYLMKQEFTWLTSDNCLKMFGESRHEAMEAFHHFVLLGIGRDDGIDFKKGISGGILGEDAFIEKMQEEIEGSLNNETLTIDLETLISVITRYYEIEAEMLQGPGMERRMSHIRAVTALLARDTVGVSLRELTDFCGRADSSMSQAAARLEARMCTSEALKNEIESLKAELFLIAGKVTDKSYQEENLAFCSKV